MQIIGLRQIFDLGGVWKYTTDPGDIAKAPDEARWHDVPVPSNWHLAGLPNYDGTVWYSRDFSLPQLTDGRIAHLRFNGVDYFTEVWVNGSRVGYHEGYFQAFTLDITEVARKQNTLLVKVTSPKEGPEAWPKHKRLIKGILSLHDCRPGGMNLDRGQDGNTGGIWNNVEVWVSDPTHIDEIRVSPVLIPKDSARPYGDEDVAKLHVEAAIVSDEVQEIEAHVRIWRSDLSPEESCAEEVRLLRLVPGTTTHTFIETINSPELWWTWDRGPQSFYTVQVQLSSHGRIRDEAEARCGVRSFSIDPDGTWHLNGQRIFPRGTNLLPAQWLSEYTPERIAEDVALLKQANVNAVRIHGHVNRTELYDALDEAGILVWQDFALQWVYAHDDQFVENATSQIKDMVRLLYNHPSIVIWACQNEPRENLRDLTPVLVNAVRQVEDDTRVVRQASTMVEHTYPGWYYGSYLEYRETPAQPLVTEFGAQALPSEKLLRETFPAAQLFPPDWEEWAYHNFQYHETFHVAGIKTGRSLHAFVKDSQEYQSRLLQFAIESYRRKKYQGVTGLFQFMFVDSWPSISWSVVDYHRTPKMGYYALQRAYQPVLASLEIRQDKVAIGQQVQIGLSIVNDLQESLTLTPTLRVLDPEGKALEGWVLEAVDVGPDSVVTLGDSIWPAQIWMVPDGTPPGVYTAEVALHSEAGELVSTNATTFSLFDSYGVPLVY